MKYFHHDTRPAIDIIMLLDFVMCSITQCKCCPSLPPVNGSKDVKDFVVSKIQYQYLAISWSFSLFASHGYVIWRTADFY